MNSSIRHIALFVPDLREAERYYQSIFDMELIGREAELADGLWYTLSRWLMSLRRRMISWMGSILWKRKRARWSRSR